MSGGTMRDNREQHIGEISNADEVPTLGTLGGWNSINSCGPVTQQAANSCWKNVELGRYLLTGCRAE